MASTIEEIQSHLGKNRAKYLEVLSKLKKFFAKNLVEQRPEFRDAIYRVNSRVDYQEDELKTPVSLWTKIRQREKELGRAVTVEEIGDVVGCRIICVFPEWKKKLIELIESENGKWFRIVPPDSEEEKKIEEGKARRGYRGRNFTIELVDPRLTGLKCEVQVITLLEEAWGCKTHDLTYKGEYARADDKEAARSLSEALKVIDDQSEAIRLRIERLRGADRRRKRVAHEFYLKRLTETTGVDDANVARWNKMCELRNYIIAGSEALRTGPIDDLLKEIGLYRIEYGLDRDICRIINLVAVLRENDELDEFAVESAGEFARGARDKAAGYRFKALTNYFFDRIGVAIETSEGGLQQAIEEGAEESIARCKRDLAYYLAELGDRNRESRARELIAAAKERLPVAQTRDSEGYVKIRFGRDVAEVNEGLQECRRAAEEDDIAKAFLPIHESRAYERLLDML